MKVILASLLLGLCSFSFAQSKVEVSKALDQMRASGMFTEEQIEAAKNQLQKMDKGTYSKLLEKAKEKSNDPAIRKRAMEIYQKQQNKNSN